MSPQLDLYFETVPVPAAEKEQRKFASRSQCLTILKLFRCNPLIAMTPFEVQHCTEMYKTPITSIRRAINTLTDAGLLVKTDILRPGEYGVLNHTWKLV